MTGENLIRIDNGSDQTRFPWLGTYRLSRVENQLLSDGLRGFQVFTDGQFPRDVARQSLLARIAADKLIAQAAPGLNRLIEKVRADLVDGIYVTNLPTEKSITYLLSLSLSSSIGSVFNYGSQNSGRLVLEVASDRSEPEDQRPELDWRTEGAWIMRERRAEWVCLLGVENTPGNYTAYAPIEPVEQIMSSRARTWLHSPCASFRSPRSSPSDATTWSAPRAVLSRSPLGHTEMLWPNFRRKSIDSMRGYRSIQVASWPSTIFAACTSTRWRARAIASTTRHMPVIRCAPYRCKESLAPYFLFRKPARPDRVRLTCSIRKRPRASRTMPKVCAHVVGTCQVRPEW